MFVIKCKAKDLKKEIEKAYLAAKAKKAQSNCMKY